MTITRAQTRAALVESIEHWRKNSEVETADEVLIGADHCALCDLFQGSESLPLCAGCPVNKHTGRKVCQATPYHSAHQAYVDFRDKACSRDGFRAAAKAEREFLEMLLAKHDAEESAQ